MGDLTLLEKTAAALGRARAAYDAPLLKALQVDGLGRTLPSGFTYTGNGGPQWLSFDQTLGRDQYQGVVYLIITNILRKANDIPWGIFKPGAKDERAALVEASHPLNAFLWKPNGKQSWSDVVEEMGGYLLLTGNTYSKAVIPEFGTKKGLWQEIYPLPSDRTWPLAGRLYLDPVQGFVFRENDGSRVGYDPTQMLHIKYWCPGDNITGLSPIQAMGKMVTSADSGLNAQVRQFQNQGPAGIVYDESSTEAWTPEQSGNVRRWFNSFFPGGRRQGELPVVGGKLGYLKLGLSAADLNVLEALQVTTRQLCSGFGYPAELLNDKEASTYNNVSEARKAAYTDAVLPLLRRLRDGINRAMSPADGTFFDIITDGIPELQENKEEQAEWLDKAWWVAVEDKQRQMGLPVEWDGPKYVVPSTLVDYADLTAPPELVPDDARPGPDEIVN